MRISYFVGLFALFAATHAHAFGRARPPAPAHGTTTTSSSPSNTSSSTSTSPTLAAIAQINQRLVLRPGSAGYNELWDYLVQDVCVDGNDNPVSGDPATCPMHRNLKIGEGVPYLVTDFDRSNNDVTYFAFSSYPVLSMQNTLETLIFKSGQGAFTSDFTYSFDYLRDGFDLIDAVNTNYASFIRTSDGGCFDQIWSNDGKDASLSDRLGGWVLFPTSMAPSNFAPSTYKHIETYNIPISPNTTCKRGSSSGVTYWNSPAEYTFETGKVLSAIRSDHFGSGTLTSSNNALERDYFTREYGFTRWEAWMPLARCLSTYGSTAPLCHPENPSTYPLQGRCSVMNVSSTGNPSLDTWGGQKWVRVDCRDETNYIPINTPLVPLDSSIAQGDGIVDINSAAVLSAEGTMPRPTQKNVIGRQQPHLR